MSDQIPFGVEFARNPDPRVASVLLLDVSESMATPRKSGVPIEKLSEGLVTYRDSIAKDALASLRVEISIITFGGSVQTECSFTTVDNFHPPTLAPRGNTPMGEAITNSIAWVRQRKDIYKANAIPYYRPWILMITDGEPTDKWESAAEQVKAGEANKEFCFFPIAVEDANMDILRKISVREPLKLKDLQFEDLFLWLSSSQQRVSHSQTTDEVELPPPTGWAMI